MIETERLILRPYTLADFEPYCAMTADPEFLKHAAGPETREDAWARVMVLAGHWSLMGYGVFAVLDKTTRRYVGETGLSVCRRGLGTDFDEADETSWAFVGASHGMGHAFEAASAAHAWHAQRRGGVRTVCMIGSDNAPSIGLANKLGYQAYRRAVYKGYDVTLFERRSDISRHGQNLGVRVA